jgi:hypothetical protein
LSWDCRNLGGGFWHPDYTTGKTLAAVLLNSAMRCCIAKISLSWDKEIMHSNEIAHGKDATEHMQRPTHGKAVPERTTKNSRTAKGEASARQRHLPRQRRTPLPCTVIMPCAVLSCTAKEPLPCGQRFAVRILAFSKKNHFYFILFTTYVYFSISFIFY